MKKRLLCALLLPVFIFTACSGEIEEEEPMYIYGYDGDSEEEIVIDNGSLALHFDPLSTKFYVEDKRSGKLWYSNHPDIEDDTSATAINKRQMQSQLTLTYSNNAGSTALLDNYDYSVSKGLYEFQLIENGIEVSYSIGDIERVYYIPYAVPEARMNEYLSQMEKSEQRKIEQYYKKYDINKLGLADNKSEILAKYPDFETTNVYELRDTIQPYLKVQLEDLFAKYGYNEDDYYSDLEIYNFTSTVDKPTFNITIRYELIGDELVVTVPLNKVEYKADYPITELNVLPYFASGGIEDEGYMFVPDGSGGIINFNNGKFNQNVYTNSVYGWDEGLYREAIISDNKANYPVFGVENNGASILCIIEEGASYANIKADVSGRGSNFNNIYAQYAMLHKETMDISAKSDKTVLLFEKSLPDEDLVQRYIFCKETGYVAMAAEYRDYLMNRYPELQKITETGVPVAVEIVGAVNKTQYRVGLPFDLPLGLTSYKEAEQMVEDLTSRGFQNVNYRLTGWFNKSVQHTVPVNVKLISELGGSGDFKSLVNTVNSGNGDLFLEADFLYMRDDALFDGFNTNSDAARYVNRERVESYPYSFVWYGERERWGKLSYLARPEYMMSLIDNFKTKINSYNADNIAFRTVGNNLAGDYDERRSVSREASMNMQIDKLRELSAAGTGIMVNNGYVYTVPFADFIIDMPLSYQGFSIIDYEVPFYQIVLHGLVNYSGRPINLAEDYTLNILRSIETGAGLAFSFMKEETSILQETKFHQFYSNEYDKWIDDATEIYNKFNDEFYEIYNQLIVNHTVLDSGVTVTEYENGTKAVVNKSDSDYNYNGNVIKSRDYLLVKGGA